MSEKVVSDSQEEKEEQGTKDSAAKHKSKAERAKEMCELRSKRSSDTIYYYMVIGGFIVMCLACVIYVFREWRTAPNLVSVISDESISRHNDMKGVPFKRGPNKLFSVKSAP